MSKIDDFKIFVKGKPELADYVNDNSMNWQKFYELWDVFGPEDQIWKNYGSREAKPVTNQTALSEYRLKDFSEMFKNMNMEKIQGNITQLKKGIGFIQEYFIKDGKTTTPKVTPSNPYISRPINKFFED